jgi:putative hydrolase of the HAD superfamily
VVTDLVVKAVLFDLGNTLVQMWIPELVYKKVLASLGIRRPVGEIREALARTEEEFKLHRYRVTYGKVPYEEYYDRWDSVVLRHLGVPEDRRLVREIQAGWFDHADCVIYPDVKDTLTKLKQTGLKTGLISTAYEEDIDAISRKAGLEIDLFDVVIGANTIKQEKPHPDVFRHALKKLNVKPEEALFIGDNIDADYKGAEKVGIRALLIQRTETKTPRLRTITSLKEIFKHISQSDINE